MWVTGGGDDRNPYFSVFPRCSPLAAADVGALTDDA
jgi:hypothetical protein